MIAWGGAPALSPRLAAHLRTLAASGGLAVLGLLVAAATRGPYVRDVVAFAAGVALIGVFARLPALLLPSTVLWLTALGTVRRLVTEAGSSSRLDPLLLVGPLALALLTVEAARRGAFGTRTPLGKAVFALSALVVIGAGNPRSGHFFTGVSSLLFVLVPLLGYWIGRALDDRGLWRVLRLVAGLGVAAAAYGLVQTLAGFPSWDETWIGQVSLNSLNVGGAVRPFASFSSASEYAVYLGVGIVIWLALATRLRSLPLALLALAVLVPALVLESSRGTAVLTLVAAGLILGARRRLPLLPAAAFGVLLLAGLTIALRSYASAPAATSVGPRALVTHEVTGLSQPLNAQNSTLNAHWSLIVAGVKSAIKDPIGRGTAAVTIAGATFGGKRFGTEADPSNMAVALGLPGLVAYLAIVALGLKLVYERARQRADVLALAALGVVVVTFLQWLNGGLYAVAFLPWLVFGWADRTPSSR